MTDESNPNEPASAPEAGLDAAEEPTAAVAENSDNARESSKKTAKKPVELPFEKKSEAGKIQVSEDTIPPPSEEVLAAQTAIGSSAVSEASPVQEVAATKPAAPENSEITETPETPAPAAPEAEAKAETKAPEPVETLSAAPDQAAAETVKKVKKKKKKKHKIGLSNVATGVVLGVGGIAAIGAIYLFTPPPTDRVPYLLDPLEKHLDANIRYKVIPPSETKDWRHDFATEQNIWTTEVGKITLGRGDAKPAENKRDYQLFLADSFFHDEPHFIEAKAAYIAANATPRIPHEKAYDMLDGELWRRIGYCDTRLGMYDEGDAWYKKAMAFATAGDKYKTDYPLKTLRNAIIDNVIENDARRGDTKAGQALIDSRAKDINLLNLESCIESPLLYDQALVYDHSGKLEKAAHFYEKAIKALTLEDKDRGVIVPESDHDNNRVLARMLMNYSHVLRKLHKNPEAIAAMRRALVIYDNHPDKARKLSAALVLALLTWIFISSVISDSLCRFVAG